MGRFEQLPEARDPGCREEENIGIFSGKLMAVCRLGFPGRSRVCLCSDLSLNTQVHGFQKG